MDILSLLENLIQFSQCSKAEYAAAVGMSPSSLSKLLGGVRFPSGGDFVKFRSDTAQFFSSHIMEKHLQSSLVELFPLIYEFMSEEELNQFLIDAITFYYQQELRTKNMADTYSTGAILNDKVRIVHLICITVSEKLRRTTPQHFDVYCSLWLPTVFYESLFERMKIGNPHGHTITFHQLYSPDMLSHNGTGLFRFLQEYEHYMNFCDVRFCVTEKPVLQPFVFSPGEYLLLFNPVSTKTPIVGYFDDFFYLNSSKDTYTAYFENSVTYDREAMLDFFRSYSKAKMDHMVDTLQLICSNMPLGYLLGREELETMTDDPVLVDQYLYFFQRLLSSGSLLNISHNLNEKVMMAGELLVPIRGVYHLPVEDRNNCIRKYAEAATGTQRPLRILFLKKHLRFSCLLIFDDHITIFTPAYKMNPPKTHFLPIPPEKIGPIIENALAEEDMVEIDPEYWENLNRNYM